MRNHLHSVAFTHRHLICLQGSDRRGAMDLALQQEFAKKYQKLSPKQSLTSQQRSPAKITSPKKIARTPSPPPPSMRITPKSKVFHQHHRQHPRTADSGAQEPVLAQLPHLEAREPANSLFVGTPPRGGTPSRGARRVGSKTPPSQLSRALKSLYWDD